MIEKCNVLRNYNVIFVGKGGAERAKAAEIVPKLDFIGGACKIRCSSAGMLFENIEAARKPCMKPGAKWIL